MWEVSSTIICMRSYRFFAGLVSVMPLKWLGRCQEWHEGVHVITWVACRQRWRIHIPLGFDCWHANSPRWEWNGILCMQCRLILQASPISQTEISAWQVRALTGTPLFAFNVMLLVEFQVRQLFSIQSEFSNRKEACVPPPPLPPG